MNNEETKKLGNRIKQLRKEKGLSQQQLADMIGYKVGTISKYEQGDRTPPYSVLLLLAQALECNVTVLADTSIEEINEGYYHEQALYHLKHWIMNNHLGGLEMTSWENNESRPSLVVYMDKESYDIYDQFDEIQKILLENFKTLAKTMGKKL